MSYTSLHPLRHTFFLTVLVLSGSHLSAMRRLAKRFNYRLLTSSVRQLNAKYTKKGNKKPAVFQGSLEKYCQNLTQMAREDKLDPLIGQLDEIRDVTTILSRRTKNNPVLVGQPGVGKTAIVEGLAQRIANKDVPKNLQKKEIYTLDLASLLAGASYQGALQERFKGILKEIEKKADSSILFIDELHTIIGMGRAGGGMDMANLLKPALARGTVPCIGATTLQEYKRYIEADAAFERRFQKILVNEPTPEDTISILRGLKERYALYHGIRIKDQALIEAVRLSDRHIADRYLPDKAIDLLDEAAAMVKMGLDTAPAEIDKLNRKIRQLEIERVALSQERYGQAVKRLESLDQELFKLKEEHKELHAQWMAERKPLEIINNLKEQIEQAKIAFARAERERNYNEASKIKYGTLQKLQARLDSYQKQLVPLRQFVKETVDETDIAKVLARWTNIPAHKLKENESQKLLAMQYALQDRVKGQEEAITKITHAIQVHRTGLTDPNRPIGSFLFLGPTGVGKTELAKTLSQYLFNDEKRLIRVDMSEYMEQHSVARLIGSPPGYVGHSAGGQLTEQVRRYPYSVILFDEIEKAHPNILNAFLQILDDGRLTDGQGRTVSFKNTVIIMTSNIGSDIILEAPEIDESVEDAIKELMHSSLRPEFLNRIDAMCFFSRLLPEHMHSIAQFHTQLLVNRIKEKDISLSIGDQVIDYLATVGYEPEFGARPLKRAIQEYIAVPLAQFLLKHPEAKKISVGIENGKIIIG